MFDRFADWFMEVVLYRGMILLLAALIFVGIPLGIFAWATHTPAETFALRVDSWACTRSEAREETYYILVGKILVPQTRQYNHCVQWTER